MLISDWQFRSKGVWLMFNFTFGLQESRKLSYAEVCQKPRKDPPPAPCQSAAPEPDPAQSPPTASHPLRELGVNKADPETSRPAGKACEGCEPHRHGSAAKGAGFKLREQHRRPFQGRRSSPHVGYNRRSGKEQNIPPRSPK